AILTKQTSSDTLTVNRMNMLARALAQKRQLELATSYAQKAKKISKKLDFKKGEANAYNIIGIMYAYKSNYPEAMKNFSAALKVWKEIGNKPGIADSYNHIGSIYEYHR